MHINIDFTNLPESVQKYLDDSFKDMSKDFISTAYNLGRIRGYLDCALDNNVIKSDTYMFLTRTISDTLQAEIFKISEKTS